MLCEPLGRCTKAKAVEIETAPPGVSDVIHRFLVTGNPVTVFLEGHCIYTHALAYKKIIPLSHVPLLFWVTGLPVTLYI